jgi:hypothetical protein
VRGTLAEKCAEEPLPGLVELECVTIKKETLAPPVVVECVGIEKTLAAPIEVECVCMCRRDTSLFSTSKERVV